MQIRLATEADIPEMHRIRTSVRENRLADPCLVQSNDGCDSPDIISGLS